jgi:hypothetical protein
MHRWYARDENANNPKLDCLQDDVSAEKTAGDGEEEKGWKSVVTCVYLTMLFSP